VGKKWPLNRSLPFVDTKCSSKMVFSAMRNTNHFDEEK
jgi:hypothetical protein